MRIDAQKWNADRIAVETKIKALKKVIRTPGYMASSQDWMNLAQLKQQATWLYKIRAQARGRQHQRQEVLYLHEKLPGETGNVRTVKAVTAEEEFAQIVALLPHYVLPEVQAAMSA